MTDASMMDIASKTYGTVSAERRNEMSGLEFVQGLVDGTLPLNTIAQTLGYDVTEAVSGRVVVTAQPSGIHLNPAGTVHGGLAATLLDSAMGLAIQSTLEKGVGAISQRSQKLLPSAASVENNDECPCPDRQRGWDNGKTYPDPKRD